MNQSRTTLRALVTVLLLAACNCFAAARVTKLVVQPDAITLRHADDEHGVVVTAVLSDGSRKDVTAQASFSMSPADVASVASNGVMRPARDGEGQLTVRFGGRSEKVRVTVTNSVGQLVPSFRQDVLPVLTKAGCNSGPCHGKLAGQNTFKLSLRGFAPEWDIDWLTKEVRSRRIDYAFPDESLIIAKAVGRAPHEGGVRFAEGSRYHRMLSEWIAARAPGPATNEADAVRIEVLPGHRTLKPGDTQQLLVRAHYRDGETRDVTWLAQFFSNDENTVKVSPEGLVTALRHGETAVRAHFQGQVEVVMFTMPHTNRVPAREFAQRNNFIDEHVMAKLRALNIPPSGLADDSTFIRRAYLDAIGTLPSSEEVRAFLADKRDDKRAQLIDRLLASAEFTDYWTLQFADLLQNRKERDHDVRGTKGVRAFHGWLREQIAANRPWNELARDVLTAKGDTKENPHVGYFITVVGEKRPEESEVTDSVAQAFLGSRIGCAKCHNHPLEKVTQDDYYHFAAFFSRVSLKRVNPMNGASALLSETKEETEQKKRIAEMEKTVVELEPTLAGLSGEALASASKKLAEQRKKLDEANKRLAQLQTEKAPGVVQPRTKKMMAPQPLDRTPVPARPGEDPRVQLAEWITNPQNQHFAGAMVNRLWKHFFSVGLVEPVDDLRASNPPTNPELWNALTREFVARGYDLRHLMRVILNSRTYQLSAATLPGNQTDQRFYSHYYARRLPAEVMLDAVSAATGVPDEFKGYALGTRAIQLPEPGVSSYFLTLFGRSDRVTACACERNGEVTLPQLLHLQNGDVLKKLRDPSSRLADWLKQDDAALLEELFLSTISRRPRAEEVAAVKETLASGDAREDVYRDLFWALLNSKEFAFNH